MTKQFSNMSRAISFNEDASMEITPDIKIELAWWIEKIPFVNNPIRTSSFKVKIFSDASVTSWGTCCNNKRTHGWWNTEEKKDPINLLQLRAVFNLLKFFAKDLRSCQVLLRVDNTTAISYVNRMEGIQKPKLNNLAKLIWQWCEKRNLWSNSNKRKKFFPQLQIPSEYLILIFLRQVTTINVKDLLRGIEILIQ